MELLRDGDLPGRYLDNIRLNPCCNGITERLYIAKDITSGEVS